MEQSHVVDVQHLLLRGLHGIQWPSQNSRASVCLSVLSIDSSSSRRRVCCWSWMRAHSRYWSIAVPAAQHMGRLNCDPIVKRSSVLWHCWLGIRKSILPIKIEWWGVGVVIYVEWGADCLHLVQLMPLYPKTPSSRASFKSRLVSPSWSWLIQVSRKRDR